METTNGGNTLDRRGNVLVCGRETIIYRNTSLLPYIVYYRQPDFEPQSCVSEAESCAQRDKICVLSISDNPTGLQPILSRRSQAHKQPPTSLVTKLSCSSNWALVTLPSPKYRLVLQASWVTTSRTPRSVLFYDQDR